MANQETTTQSPPEVSARTAAAQALIAKVRAMRNEIPDFTSPGFQGDARPLINAASVSTAFIERTAVAVTNTPLLVRPNALDPAISRDLVAFGDAFTRWPTSWKRWLSTCVTASPRPGTRPAPTRS